MGYLYPINWMNILHAVEDNPPNLLQTLIRTHSTYCCPLHKNVTLRQQLDSLKTFRTLLELPFPEDCSYLQRAPVRPNYPLPPLHKPFLIGDDVPDLDDVARDGVV
jgi:hypothetical protein